MTNTTALSSINVEGLHDQYDVHLDFKPGLNIIYGKNGRGKTTVLHIIANALELDFRRFHYLTFRKITIKTLAGDCLEINKTTDGERCSVALNGSATTNAAEGPSLSEAESAAIRISIGDRATYLPAFRSVLERIRSESTAAYYRADGARELELETLEQSEFHALRDAYSKIPNRAPREALELRSLREEAGMTARKTNQCRQWFGAFVPVVRYPSIIEVEDGLSAEWRSAQLEMAQREQNMFADVFVKVFRTIAGIDTPSATLNTEDLLSSISDSVSSSDSQLGNRESIAIYQKLLEAAGQLKQRSQGAEGIENAVLALYLQSLVDRKEERRIAFQKSRLFEESINRFLDRKTLKIGVEDTKIRTRSVVRVGTQAGRNYGLGALSSGEKQVLTMLYSASRSRFRSGAFLIDEPELSLHVDWQRHILRELMRQAPNRQIIACTHSPEVGGDHIVETQDFEPATAAKVQDSLFSDDEQPE